MPETWGTVVEREARDVAARLGVPDFVYGPAQEHRGSRNREISDGLLLCGDEGLILQVKARDRESAAGDDRASAERWVLKEAAKAKRQADGTRTRLRRSDPVEFTSLRGYCRTISSAGDFPAVVIIDHPLSPGVKLAPHADTMWITLTDWQALHEYLRSTAAVIGYVRRALASGLTPTLGNEYARYRKLAQADARTRGGPTSLPMLPLEPFDTSERHYADVVDDVIGFVWPSDGLIPWRSPDEYRRIVEMLDRIPPRARPTLGRKIVRAVGEAEQSGRMRSSFFCKVTAQGQAQVCFLADTLARHPCDDPELDFHAELLSLAATRHAQATRVGLRPLGPTLAIGRLHDRSRGVLYAFALVEGLRPDEPPPEVQWTVSADYGVFVGTSILPVEQVGRNDSCPCGHADRRFKSCHLARL